MKLLKITLVAVFITTGVFSQSKYVADKYFSQFAYTKAASMYTELYNKGNKSYEVVSKIADSYYFNTKTEDAEKWYEILKNNYSDKISVEHLFRYAQSLKSNGNYKKSDAVMKVIDKNDSTDSRPDKLQQKPDYASDYIQPELEVLSFTNLKTNSKYSDFGGFVSGDKLYFSSSKPIADNERIYKWNEQPYLNLYSANILSNSNESVEIGSSSLLQKPLRTKYHEATAVITKDGKTMYFTRDNFNNGTTGMSKDKKVLLKLYRASLVDGNWTDIKELPFNNKEYSIGHPALSLDEKTLYFTSNMPGGYGNTDIYKVAILPEQKYGQPENLGKSINTEGREMFPYVSVDNTLYFASDGHLGLGGLDIFETSIKDDGYGDVKNLEAPFNSPKDDFAFYIAEDNKKGFISSNRKGGKGDDDIYSFVLKYPKNTLPPVVSKEEDCKQVVSGITTDANSGDVLPEATVKLVDKEGKIVDRTTSNNQGVYKFTVDCLTKYTIAVSKSNYKDGLKEINSTDLDKGSNLVNLALTPLIVKNEIKLNPIYFAYGKYNIRPDAEYELEHVVTVMKENPDIKIRIESHTDSRSSKQFNLKLSQNRANSTKRYIVSRGISPYRIVEAIGYGEEQLLNDCDDANASKCTEEQHQQNRRSYFYIVK